MFSKISTSLTPEVRLYWPTWTMSASATFTRKRTGAPDA